MRRPRSLEHVRDGAPAFVFASVISECINSLSPALRMSQIHNHTGIVPKTPATMASYSSDNEKIHSEHHEHLGADIAPAFTDGDHEPELHSRTWLAFASMCVIQYVQISALLGPPTAVSESFSFDPSLLLAPIHLPNDSHTP